AHLCERTRRRGLMIRDAQYERTVLADRHERAVLAALEHFLAEHRLDDVRIAAELAAALLAREVFDGAQRQIHRLRHRLELGQARKRQIREPLRGVVESALRLSRAIFLFEFRTGLLEALYAAALDVLQLDDVIAELRLHGPADLAGLHREQRFLERPDEHAALRPAEISALLRRARILGVLLRERSEIAARPRLLGELGRLLFRLCVLG